MIEQIPIKSREQWQALRKADCTASAIPCLLGVHRHMTLLSYYLLKAGLIEEDPEETGPMRRGRLLESVAVQILREDHPGWKIQYPVGLYFRDKDARLGCTPDCLVTDETGKTSVIQIKSVEATTYRRVWKEDGGTISPPLYVVVQAIVEAHLTGAQRAAVAALIVGYGIELNVVEIPIHAGIIDRIKAEVRAFWKRVESGDVPQVDYARDGALIARLYPEGNGSIIDLSSDNQLPVIAAEYTQLTSEKRKLDSRRLAIKTEFLAKLGNASGAIFQGGRVTANTVHRKAYQVAASQHREVRIKLED